MLATDGEGGRRSGISGTAGESCFEFDFCGERGREGEGNQHIV